MSRAKAASSSRHLLLLSIACDEEKKPNSISRACINGYLKLKSLTTFNRFRLCNGARVKLVLKFLRWWEWCVGGPPQWDVFWPSRFFRVNETFYFCTTLFILKRARQRSSSPSNCLRSHDPISTFVLSRLHHNALPILCCWSHLLQGSSVLSRRFSIVASPSRNGNIGRPGDDGKREARCVRRGVLCSMHYRNRILCLDGGRGSSVDARKDEVYLVSSNIGPSLCRSFPGSRHICWDKRRFQSKMKCFWIEMSFEFMELGLERDW